MKAPIEKDYYCPLCSTNEANLFHQKKAQAYYRCTQCLLVFLAPQYYLSPEQEKTRYTMHNNSISNKGYVDFLMQLIEPLQTKLAPLAHGLDFGCGPNPVLQSLMQQAGFSVDIYDPFFYPDTTPFSKRYDFITATEVLEHFHQPYIELSRMWQCLNPGGWLGIMTSLYSTDTDFSTWYYINDPTHVCFYTHKSLHWIAKQWHASHFIIHDKIALFEKQDVTNSHPQ